MPSTNTNSSIIDSLRQRALEEVKEKQRDWKAEKSEFESHVGAQDAKPIDKELYFERAAAALDVEQHLASQLIANPDGTFPCPHCFIGGHKNTLDSYGINYNGVSEFRCEVCNTSFNVGS